jgi:ATP/ADP translocase/HEAT repeat protein/CRP-like cAMP-binding protein
MADSSTGSLATRLLKPFAEARTHESTTALLMFAYSFLAMTSYNIIQPITRSKFIADLGAANIPYVQFVSGLLIGVIMQAYAKGTGLLPRRWVIPLSQSALVGILILFWVLFQSGQEWVSVAFYLLGQIFAILLISQFWTLANAIYDPRQAKRIFGFIGGGASLGGAMGAGISSVLAETVGTNRLLLVSAGALTACVGMVILVLRREGRVVAGSGADEERGLAGKDALRLFLASRQIQLIAVIIGFGALGAALLDQQLNMATEEFKGRQQEDAITAFLAGVRFWLSFVGFLIQVFLTSRVHRLLGIGFALLILPVSLGVMAGVILVTAALGAAASASVVDRSLRYTVDKTTREILFMPLPTEVKLQAKPFVDVTVDRLSKGIGALMLLVLIKPWGLGLTWRQLSFATLTLVLVWFFMAIRAKREYVASFRRSLEQQAVQPAEIRFDTADLNTIETLVSELSHPDPRHVVYAVDLLESLGKRHLVTPLLLHHASPQVRARALAVAEAAGPDEGVHWRRGIERALKDSDGGVRLAAVRALASRQQGQAMNLMRQYLQDADPQLVVTAASALAESPDEADRSAAEDALRRLSADTRDQAVPVRLEVARALAHVDNPAFRPLLLPLMYDADLSVAREAITSLGRLEPKPSDVLFVPALVSLMRNRLLKAAARRVLVGYGDDVVDALAYFLRDPHENVWVRRHVPSTLGLIPTQQSLDVLAATLADADGFTRYKAGAAIDRIRETRPDLQLDRALVERQVLLETTRAFNALTLHHNLFVAGGLDQEALLAQALVEKRERATSRIFRLLRLIYPPADIAAVSNALENPDARLRSGAMEYFDNLLEGDVRRRVLLLLEDMPAAERVRRGNVIFKTRQRDVEDTLAQLVHDEDQVIAACAIQLVEQRQMWGLADDLEHALAHRDARDWYVFEAASWALAARRMPVERRRALWLEPLPAVELASRLRRVRLFSFASVDELFRIAVLGRQVRHEPGRVLYEAGRPVETLQFLLEGQVSIAREADEPRHLAAPDVIGFEAILEGSPATKTIRAVDTVITLSLTSEEFLSLLSENVEIAQGIFRLLIDRRGAPGWHAVMHGEMSPALQRKAASGLQAVDRILLLQSSPLLARASAAQLASLAGIARSVTLKPGEDPLAGHEPAVLVVIGGSIQIERDGAPLDTANAGDVLGIYETFGGVPFPITARVVTAGQGLRFVRSDLFDLLADDIDLLQGIFSGLMQTSRRTVPSA